jgi:Formylmethanofuran dehydrogenase subunit D
VSYLLISGRTIDQATGMHVGKLSETYRKAVSMIEMNAADMEREGLADGDAVRVSSPSGAQEGWARKADLPAGMVFIPMGPVANAISGSDTEGTGMPLFKGFSVEIEKIEGRQDGDNA